MIEDRFFLAMENNKFELKEKGNIFIQEDCSNSVTTTRK